MNVRKYRYFACDFETTVYEGQTDTEVWASACVELDTENVLIFHSIDAQFQYFFSLKQNLVLYFHNLKFDGEFIMYYLIHDLKMKQAYTQAPDKPETVKWTNRFKMDNNTFQYNISNRGQWYLMTIKINNVIIEIRDSLKLIPFKLETIGKAFETKHRKLTMEYTGYRYAGCTITDEEKEYISNDVLVLKEALEIMFKQGHNKLTIGACCLSEYKQILKVSTKTMQEYKEMFPQLYNVDLPISMRYATVGHYIRKSYKGGWCYVVKGKEKKFYHNGITMDVNSLYPSMMHSMSGNYYPIGLPHIWQGNFIPEDATKLSFDGKPRYFFIRIKTRFYLKENYLPFIQLKGNALYRPTEYLESSDIIDTLTGEKVQFYLEDGEVKDTRTEVVLTCTDYYLFLEHYDVVDFEILDGIWFYTDIGIFDEYIDKYKEIKMKSKGAQRTLAKLYLNNLYGKMAMNDDSSFKVAVLQDDIIRYYNVIEHEKTPSYIAVGSAITSYARNFTIRTAQKNYHGKNKRGFIYADTDSIHCNLSVDELIDVPIHDTEFCHWAKECEWSEGWFVRQKTYIEKVDGQMNITCAGMPQKSKEQFIEKLETGEMTLQDFDTGLQLSGKLIPKRIKGGVILQETMFTMRGI